MTHTCRRVVVLLISLVVLLLVLHKSRTVPLRAQAAFVRYSAGVCMVRVAGTGINDGIYRFNDAVLAGDDKILTLCPTDMICRSGKSGRHLLQSGDLVKFNRQGLDYYEISVGIMPVPERIVLGIPLDPDKMSVTDWENIPGIGQGLAKDIICDRQKNGYFGSVYGLLRVPGVGKRKLDEIRKYF